MENPNNENKDNIIFEAKISYNYFDDVDEIISKGEAKIQLFEENLSAFPERDTVIIIPLREILNLDFEDYRANFDLVSKEKLEIYDLGYKYEDFAQIFTGVYNELVVKDMLMKENLRRSGIDAEFILYDEKGNEKQKGNCELRLYDTL